MNHVLRDGLAVVTVLFAAACGRSGAGWSPTAPAVPVASPATPITLGQTLTGVVKLSDARCEELFDGHDEGPCQRFAITIPTSGTLNVHVTSPGPSWLALRVGSSRTTYGVIAVDAAGTVPAGAHEFSVALYEAVNGNPDQTFELTTSLDPPKAARP